MRLEFARPWVRSPAGLHCAFSSDPAVSSSPFVRAESEENLIRNDPDKSKLSIQNFAANAGERIFLTGTKVFAVTV